MPVLLLSSLLSPASAATIAFDTWMPVPSLARHIEGRIGVQAFVENAPYGHHEFVPVLNIHGQPTRWREPRRQPYTVVSTATNATEAAEEVRAFQVTWQASEYWDGCTTYSIEVYEDILEVTPSRAVDTDGNCGPYVSRLDEVLPELERGEDYRLDDLNVWIRQPTAPGVRTIRDALRATLVANRDVSAVLVNVAREGGRSSSIVKTQAVGSGVGSAAPEKYPFHPKHREPPPHLRFENQPEVQAHRAWIANGSNPAEHPDLQDLPEDLRQQLIEDAEQQNTAAPQTAPTTAAPAADEATR